MDSLFDFEKFLDAQNPVFSQVCSELRQARKESHWMWFIFPQLKGLGSSWMAGRYAISSRAEAEAYLAHPILGSRLVECTGLVNNVDGASIEQILGRTDAMKFRSSMTLFANAATENTIFADALRKYFGGRPDQLTLDLLFHVK